MEENRFILERIPHRPPFLWVDRVREISEDRILAEKQVPEDLDIFRGHYPDYPILPGVLICEALFQTGALLISEMMNREDGGEEEGDILAGVPVLTRIHEAKFKRGAYPGDNLALEVTFKEKLGNAWFMKGTARISGKTAVKVEFACTLAEEERIIAEDSSN
ncbi:MAG: 3-hydroxyacyl-ACP dehydratase FabZ [Desulfurivibrionaceae bacterium]